MAERMLGLETEYAFASYSEVRRPLRIDEGVAAVLSEASRAFKSMPSSNSAGVFFGNGGLLYIDCGSHLEMSTPECLNPWDLVRYTLAGERILTRALQRVVQATPAAVKEIGLFKCNVDYFRNSRSTWGCHESYLHTADRSRLAPQLIPHLVSRIIYTGAGGWSSRKNGLHFLISPRAAHMRTIVSDSSTHSRGIFHTKDEPLCRGGYSRLHLLCGESLHSHTASWLKVATTALIVAMIEAGIDPGDGVDLRYPLAALRRFASDVTCSIKVPVKGGKPLSALEIQKHYLARAWSCRFNSFMPLWAESVCKVWREVLERMEKEGPESLAAVLDWPIKLQVFREQVRKEGIEWADSSASPTFPAAPEPKDEPGLPDPATVDPEHLPALLGMPSSDARQALINLELYEEMAREGEAAYLRRRGLASGPEKMDPKHRELRDRLFELDWRFGQLGDKGVFNQLDQAGRLAHRLEGVDSIEHAMENPPSAGRAKLRGESVKQLSNNDHSAYAMWSKVVDRKESRILNLSDPFESEERWNQVTEDSRRGMRVRSR